MSVQPIKFPYVRERAYNAVLWLLHQHGGMLDRIKLIKLVFLVDLEHLSRYGRPVVGGGYVAMKHGPVASWLLHDINCPSVDLPFEAVGPFNVRAKTLINEEHLSESDIEVMRDVNARFGDLDRFVLRDLSHCYKCWERNFDGENTSYPLPYEDFFLDIPEERQGMLEVIRDEQEAWALLS